MPQPIHNPDLVPVNFTPGAILKEPWLSAHIGVISSMWSDLEGHIAAFLAAILNSRTTVAMFLAITNDGAKRAAIDAAARETLTKAHQEQLQTLLTKIGHRYADRNTVVHGVWGISSKYPNRLLWADVRETTLFHADMMKLEREDAENDVRFTRMMRYQKTLILYEERDFVAIKDRVQKVLTEFAAFGDPFIGRAFGKDVLVLPKRPAPPLRGKRGRPAPSDDGSVPR